MSCSDHIAFFCIVTKWGEGGGAVAQESQSSL